MTLASYALGAMGATLLAGCSGSGAQGTTAAMVANPVPIRISSVVQPNVTVTKVASIPFPQGIDVDSHENIYVAQPRSNRITRINTDSSRTTIGSGFKHPMGVVVRKGFAYVADFGNAAVKRVAPDGRVGSIAPGAWGGPNALAVASTGDLYVSDGYNAMAVSRVAPDGTVSPVLTQQNCMTPSGVAVDSAQNVFVACNSSNRVLKVTPSGTISQVGPNFSDLLAVAVDEFGNVFVTTDRHGNYEIPPVGSPFQIGGGYQFGISRGMAANRPDALYVGSYNHGAIYKITP